MYAYFLSQNEARDITLAATDIGRSKLDPPCPAELTTLLHAMQQVAIDARPLMSHPLACTNKAPAPIKAYGILARAAAKVAREYWRLRGC